jgi:hypothetical protein
MSIVETAPEQKRVVMAGGTIETEVEHFLQRGIAQLKEDPQSAYRMFKVASDLNPADGRAMEAIRDAERIIRAALGKEGIKGDRIPELAIPDAELTRRSFSPQEGFVLSRINGQWDVKSIMKISPMKELDVLMIFQRFLQDGVIHWKKK